MAFGYSPTSTTSNGGNFDGECQMTLFSTGLESRTSATDQTEAVNARAGLGVPGDTNTIVPAAEADHRAPSFDRISLASDSPVPSLIDDDGSESTASFDDEMWIDDFQSMPEEGQLLASADPTNIPGQNGTDPADLNDFYSLAQFHAVYTATQHPDDGPLDLFRALTDIWSPLMRVSHKSRQAYIEDELRRFDLIMAGRDLFDSSSDENTA